tara:strand:- start:1412 stop:2146 length:735 start_codon:yes stop_codon:yes gene_type:complete
VKVVLTGASGGMGLKIFMALCDLGFDIACCSKSMPQLLVDLIKEKNDLGGNHVLLNLDLELDESIQQCLKKIEIWAEKRVDILINCAGMSHGSLVNMTRIDDLKKVFQVNFFGQIMLTQKVSRYIARNGGGRIINIASHSGLRADRGTLAYGSSKAALIHATKIMAAEYAVDGISVNAIAPSITDTNMALDMDPKVVQKILNQTAIGRKVQVEEIVSVVVFLVKHAPLALTGEVLKVDGCISLI